MTTDAGFCLSVAIVIAACLFSPKCDGDPGTLSCDQWTRSAAVAAERAARFQQCETEAAAAKAKRAIVQPESEATQ